MKSCPFHFTRTQFQPSLHGTRGTSPALHSQRCKLRPSPVNCTNIAGSDMYKRVRKFLGISLEGEIMMTGWNFGLQQEYVFPLLRDVLTALRTALSDLMLRELYWRHTKETVKGEYQIPECVEDLVLMDFDEIESALYSDARDEGTMTLQVMLLIHLFT